MASIIQPVGNFMIIFCSAAMKISAEIKSGSSIEHPSNTKVAFLVSKRKPLSPQLLQIIK